MVGCNDSRVRAVCRAGATRRCEVDTGRVSAGFSRPTACTVAGVTESRSAPSSVNGNDGSRELCDAGETVLPPPRRTDGPPAKRGDGVGNVAGTEHGILMLAVAPPGAAEVAVVAALQVVKTCFFRIDAKAGERVVVTVAGDDQRGLVDAQAQGLARLDSLQSAEVAGEPRGVAVRSAEAIVSAGPGVPASGAQAGVCVQDHLVAAVRRRAEDQLFGKAGTLQQLQCLISAAGEDHLVEAFGTGAAVHRDPETIPGDALHRTVKSDTRNKAARLSSPDS